MDLSRASRDVDEAKKLRKQDGVSASIDGAGENEKNQDEKASKRLRRLMANRASAEKSRQRKQAELVELHGQVKAFSKEIQDLKEKLLMAAEESEKLSYENKLLKNTLAQVCGPDFVSKLVKGDVGAT